MAEKHGDAGLATHTEASPLNPPPPLMARSGFGVRLLENTPAAYDAAILRPTIVYGHSSSFYGQLFDLASRENATLRIQGDPDAIMHSVHVDDCAEAYVALAEHSRQEVVAGQAFNISNQTYETARDIAGALGRCYGLEADCVGSEGLDPATIHTSVHFLANYWQWVSSEKLRTLTGWRERRPTFVEGIEQYRLAYEAMAVC